MAGSIVQQWGAENGSSGTTLATGVATVTAGNFLVIQTNSDTAVTCTVTQNAGTATIGTVTEQTSVTEAATFETTKTYTCEVTGSGTLDLLATFGASDANREIFAWEITGVDSYFGANAQTDTGSNPTTTCTVASVVAPAFAFMLCIDVQGGTPTVGSGYTDFGTFGSAVHFGRVQYKAVAANGSVTGNFGNAGFDRTNSVLVIWNEPSPPAITVQPVQQTVASGATATFSVTATGATSYQWQINSAGTWTNVSTGTGGTSSSYTTGTLGTSDIGNLYRCQVTNAAGTVNTAEVFVFLTNQPSAGKGERGYGSAWARKTVRRTGNIRSKTVQFLRAIANRTPNKDNTALTTVWFNWFFPAATSTVPTGTLNKTENPDNLVGAGTTTVRGSLARTNANDTLSSNATPIVTGSLARTNANDTLSAAASPIANGSLNRSNQDDTLVATGTAGIAPSGSLSRQEQPDTLSASGTTTVVGSLARTNADDTVSASGTTTVVGSLSRTNSDDTLSATGSSGSAPVGTLGISEQPDTLAASGTTTVVGSLSRTNGDDTVVATANTIVVGSLGVNEGRDTLVATGTSGSPPVGGTKFWRWLGLTLERMGL